MKPLIALLFIGCPLLAIGGDLQSPLPSGEITTETPSIENAYPNEVYVKRTTEPSNDTISYEVRIYAAEAIDTKRISSHWEVALVVRDQQEKDLISTRVDVSAISTTPPNTNEFRSFFFTIHKSLEATTVVNIGRDNGLRVLFTRYKLPMKSIDHSKAH
jgi:hypothetical protein